MYPTPLTTIIGLTFYTRLVSGSCNSDGAVWGGSFVTPSGRPGCSKPWGGKVLSELHHDAFEKWMRHLALGRLRAVLDFGQQRRLDPDATMRDLLGVGLRLADQRF
jgi:hypothetical protein